MKYSDNAQVVTPLSFMTDAGKAKVKFALEAMHTEGCTNIWDGILKGMETLRTRPEDTAEQDLNSARRVLAIEIAALQDDPLPTALPTQVGGSLSSSDDAEGAAGGPTAAPKRRMRLHERGALRYELVWP